MKSKVLRTIQGAALLVVGAGFFAPFLWMILVSLHPSNTPIPTTAQLIPHQPAWQNFAKVVFNPALPVGRFLLNSVIVSTCVVVVQTLVSALAGYGFAQYRFKGRGPLFAAFLGSMMVSGTVTQIPVYLLLRDLHWLDTFAALIVPGLSSAFSVFLFRQSFLGIPTEMLAAAKLDGASDFTVFTRIALPVSKATVATSATFTFIGVWTDFFGPLITTNSTNMRTLEVGLSIFKNSYGGTNWPLQMAAALIVMMPILIVFSFGQRYFTSGISLGSLK